jgi:hypothetical protein
MTNQATMASTETPDGAKRMSGDDLRKRGLALADECASLRGRLRTLTEQRQRARQRLSESLSAFMRGVGPRVTPEANARNFIRASQQERADRAAGRSSPPAPIVPGPSYEDRSRAWQGDSDTFARKQHRNGGNSRGAYPRSMLGHKLPSSR